jgi:hypothetical protein
VEGSCEHGNEPSDSIKMLGNSLVSAKLAASPEERSFLKLDLRDHHVLCSCVPVNSSASTFECLNQSL